MAFVGVESNKSDKTERIKTQERKHKSKCFVLYWKCCFKHYYLTHYVPLKQHNTKFLSKNNDKKLCLISNWKLAHREILKYEADNK